jgi:hypothetical protein
MNLAMCVLNRFENASDNSPPKLGGVPFARFLANGGVVPRDEIHFGTGTTPSAPLMKLRDIFLMAQPPLLT